MKDSISSVKWSAIEKYSLQSVQFLIGIVLARLLSPEDFGTIGMIAIFLAIADNFIDGGFSNALIQKHNRTEVDYSTAFYFNVCIGVLACFTMYVSAPLIASFFQTEVLSPICKTLSFLLLFNSLTVVQVARLSAIIDFKTQAKVSFLSALLSGLLGILCAWKGLGVWSLVFQALSNSVMKVILLWSSAKWLPSLVFSFTSFKQLFSFGSKLLFANLINTFYTNIITLVIGKFYSKADLGYYTRGNQFASFPSANLASILQRATFPIMTNFQKNDEELLNIYKKYIRHTSMVIFFCMFLLFTIAKPLILTLLGDKWEGSVIYLQIFCFALMFDHISRINLNLLLVKGRSDLTLKLEIIKKIISFALLLISIPFGVLAICLSRIVYSQIALFFNTYYTGKLFNWGYISQYKEFSRYFLASILACLVPFFIVQYSSLPNFLTLVGVVPISSVIYGYLLRKDSSMTNLLAYMKIIKR